MAGGTIYQRPRVAPQAAVSRAALVMNEDIERDGQLPPGARRANREVFIGALAPAEERVESADAHHHLATQDQAHARLRNIL